MNFDQVVFYGRLGRQGLAMFNLDPAQWRGARVLDCPGGPGSLSAELRAVGVDVTAVDPLYSLGEAELRQRALGELQRVSRRSLRIDPAHTIERQARRHPYALRLLAELPAGWQGRFTSTTYDQGHDGFTDGLELERVAGPCASGLNAAGSWLVWAHMQPRTWLQGHGGPQLSLIPARWAARR